MDGSTELAGKTDPTSQGEIWSQRLRRLAGRASPEGEALPHNKIPEENADCPFAAAREIIAALGGASTLRVHWVRLYFGGREFVCRRGGKDWQDAHGTSLGEDAGGEAGATVSSTLPPKYSHTDLILKNRHGWR